MDVSTIIRTLQLELERVEKAIAQLEGLQNAKSNATGKGSPEIEAWAEVDGVRRTATGLGADEKILGWTAEDRLVKNG
jgi:hypothetical protein